MTQDDPYADRKQLTFEQAEGVEPLPVQLLPKELTKQLRALLWALVYDSMKENLKYHHIYDPWRSILYTYHVKREHLLADEFDNSFKILVRKFKSIFLDGTYANVFGFLQHILRHPDRPRNFERVLDYRLKEGGAGYRVLDGRTIIPITSEAELATLKRAFADLSISEFRGARSHLQTAGSELTAGDYTSSIRESIHAVESVANALAIRNWRGIGKARKIGGDPWWPQERVFIDLRIHQRRTGHTTPALG